MEHESEVWARLRKGQMIDEIADAAFRLFAEIGKNGRDAAAFHADIRGKTLEITVHRITLVGRVQHVYFINDGGRKDVLGAIEFRRSVNGQESDAVLHTIYFDRTGYSAISGDHTKLSDPVKHDEQLWVNSTLDAFTEKMLRVIDDLVPVL